ncbi:MAG: UbiD family decarboxylase, partial [Deltaproteobacteria bacterium]|nr:UbiD family decarboxylase [Deltaproteobacteria bacterium]
MNLKDCLRKLESEGRLCHVKTEVDPVHELSGIAARLEGGKVVQFDRVKGSEFPVVTGLWWIRDYRACVFGCETERLSFLFSDAVAALHSNPVAPVVVENAPAQSIVMDTPDLTRIPVPTH